MKCGSSPSGVHAFTPMVMHSNLFTCGCRSNVPVSSASISSVVYHRPTITDKSFVDLQRSFYSLHVYSNSKEPGF